ncbi:MAG: hypothetical protein JNK04_12120, partial [Myxococcales bacterium]|nr:hypothetical protein [Myxococcales bacterium]
MLVRTLSAVLFVGICACGGEGAGTSGSSSATNADASAKSSNAPAKAAGDMVSCDNAKMGLCSEWRG